MIPNIVLVGSPGSGKGSLATFLTNNEGYVHICSGDLLRDEIVNSTPLGISIRDTLKEGGQVADEIITSLVLNKLEEAKRNHSPIVLDGFPQTIGQKDAFDQYIKSHSSHIFRFVSLHVTPETALERMVHRISCLKCHEIYNLKTKSPQRENECDICHSLLNRRDSDSEEKARKRLILFEQTTRPVIDMYESEGHVKVIDANLSSEEIINRYKEIS